MAGVENVDVLTRVGPGTPMGELFRQYWLPVLMSTELPAPDGPPRRVRLLGENLVAFRDTGGRVGLLAHHCAHRGASLFFGRNEHHGLRCVYHGWKYDVSGRCIDIPTEPPESTFKDRVRQPAYPCREQAGVIWAYLGPRPEPPPMPDLEWTKLPATHCVINKTLRECNWLQALEGDIDNAHVPFLHRHVSSASDGTASRIMYSPQTPHFEVVPTPYGAMYGVRRDADEYQYNWRIIQFLFPSFTMITTGSVRDAGTVPSHMWVPIDDENTMQWGIKWNPAEPISEELRQYGQSNPGAYLPNTTDWLGQWRPVANRHNDYLIDREAQRTVSFTGIANIPLQDKAVTESMGPIADRTREHLASTDVMIIFVRRRLIQAVKALRDLGTTPPGVDAPELYRVRSAIVNLPKGANWVAETRDLLKAFTGRPAASLA